LAATLSLGQDTAEVLGFETFEVPNLRLGSQELAVSGQQSILSGAEVQGKNFVGFGELLVVLISHDLLTTSKWSCSSFYPSQDRLQAFSQVGTRRKGKKRRRINGHAIEQNLSVGRCWIMLDHDMCRVSFLCMAVRPSRPSTDASMYSCILPCMGKNREKNESEIIPGSNFHWKTKRGECTSRQW